MWRLIKIILTLLQNSTIGADLRFMKLIKNYGHAEKQRFHYIAYSARHQFVEDAKKAGVSLEELAAIMGHASIETATFHYGRKAAGKPGNFKVTANSADLERVKNSNLHREQGHKNHPTLLH